MIASYLPSTAALMAASCLPVSPWPSKTVGVQPIFLTASVAARAGRLQPSVSRAQVTIAIFLPDNGFGPVVGPFQALGEESASIADFCAAATAAAAS